MPDLKDFVNEMNQLQEDSKNGLKKLVTTMVITAKALSERNIKERGFGKEYSDYKLPVFFFIGKELNAGGTEYIESRKETKSKKIKKLEDITEKDLADGMGNWGEFRAAQGLQVEHVDLSYSNKMWASMSPTEVQEIGLIFRSELGSTNEEGQSKMNFSFERYGDFIMVSLNDDDRKVIDSIVLNGLKEIIEKSRLIK